MPALLEMHGIVKTYGAVRANRGIDLTVGEGQVVGLLGENGSGKSTLMKVLFGVVRADSGSISFNGQPLVNHSPYTALMAGIGMIHQHFTLVEAMTVAENIQLGNQSAPRLKPAQLRDKIAEVSHSYGLAVDPKAIVGNLSLGRRQRVEIVKAILWGSKLLIFDEPTSNLSPPEVAGLLAAIRILRQKGHSVVFISHKLSEVMEICDKVVVLRDGAVSGQVQVSETTKESLARMMVDRDLPPPIDRKLLAPGRPLLTVDGLSVRNGSQGYKVRNTSFSVRVGEILGIAGVDGNGQRELLDCLAGITHATSGRILLDDGDITQMNVQGRLEAGIAYIPADRAKTSLIPHFSVSDNLAMRDLNRPPLAYGPLIRATRMKERARSLMTAFDIRATGPEVAVNTLSGGNQQKIVVAREVARAPKVILALQPTWGLDPGSTRFVLDQMLALRDAGAAVVYVSAELEEVLTLSDQIAVMSGGHLSPPHARQSVDITQIGMLMAGAA